MHQFTKIHEVIKHKHIITTFTEMGLYVWSTPTRVHTMLHGWIETADMGEKLIWSVYRHQVLGQHA